MASQMRLGLGVLFLISLSVVLLQCGESNAEPPDTASPSPTASPTTEPATPPAKPATATPEPTPDPFASDRVSCTEEVLADPDRHYDVSPEVLRRYRPALKARAVADRKRHIDVLADVMKRYKAALESSPAVIGVGVGEVRWEAGRGTLRPGIIVLAHSQLIEGDQNSASFVPSMLEGCEVAVHLSHIELDERITCTEQLKADRRAFWAALENVAGRNERAMRAHPGVVGGKGVGYPGESDEVGIIVSIDPDFVTSELDPRDLIPHTVEGCPVFVRIIEETTAL